MSKISHLMTTSLLLVSAHLYAADFFDDEEDLFLQFPSAIIQETSQPTSPIELAEFLETDDTISIDIHETSDEHLSEFIDIVPPLPVTPVTPPIFDSEEEDEIPPPPTSNTVDIPNIGKIHTSGSDHPSKQALLAGKEWEPAINSAIQLYVKPGTTAIDIGAHLGVHTLHMARKVSPNGRVYAFEPNYTQDLRANIALNSLSNITLLPSINLDNVSNVSFIKIHAPRLEQQILLAARSIIARSRPVILIQYSIPDLTNPPAHLKRELTLFLKLLRSILPNYTVTIHPTHLIATP